MERVAHHRSRRAARGFSLLELLIVLGIFAVFTGLIFEAFRSLGQAQLHQERLLKQLQASRAPLHQMLRELQMCGTPGRSSFSAATAALFPGLIADGYLEATATSAVFETDLGLDGAIERIEYRVSADGSSLMRRVYPKALNGAIGPATAVNDAFLTNLANSTLPAPLPVFTWELDPASPQPYPNNIGLAYVSLAVQFNPDPRHPANRRIIYLPGAVRRANPAR